MSKATAVCVWLLRASLLFPVGLPAAAGTVPAPPWTSGEYLYDGSGSVKAIGADRYVYDPLGRLVSGAGRGSTSTKTQQYEFDGFGNLKKITVVGETVRNIAVDSNTNRLASVMYDAAGNQLNDGFVTQVRMFDAFNSMTVNLDGAQYLYDAADQRIAITNEARTEWRWTIRDPGARVIREFTETTSGGGAMTIEWKRDSIYRGSALIGSYVREGATTKRLHHHVDHLGTPRLTTDASAIGRFSISDYPFGEEVEPAANVSETHHFTGHERDRNSDGTTLDYMHARYYSPIIGRFLSIDPALQWKRALRQPQRWNRYSYVVNNPLTFTDPTGRVIELPANCANGKTVCQELKDIRNGLPAELHKFVQAQTQNGKVIVNASLLNEARKLTNSDNFLALRQVANARAAVAVSSTTKSFTTIQDGQRTQVTFGPIVWGEEHRAGRAVTPRESLTGQGQVFVNPYDDDVDRATAMGHELLGHWRRYMLGLPWGHGHGDAAEDAVDAATAEAHWNAFINRGR